MIKQLHYESPLALWLKKNGMSQRELSVRTGASQNMVSRYVAGIAVPTGDRLERITTLTGLTSAQLEAGRYTSR